MTAWMPARQVITKRILDEKKGLAACQPEIALADSLSSFRRHVLDDTHEPYQIDVIHEAA